MNTKEENVNYDKGELEPINEELENSVAKLLSENERLCKEINHVKQVFKDEFDSIKQTCVRHKEHSDSLINKMNLKSAENDDLKAQFKDKVFVIKSLKNDLRKLKGKEIAEKAVHIPFATTIVPGMFKLDLEPLAPKLETQDSNKPVLQYTGVKCFASASGSKPSGNTKNNRISQPLSSNKINKVEDKARSVKIRKNKKNPVTKVKCDDHVMQSMSNANSVFVSINNALVKNSMNDVKSGCLCAICGRCMIAETYYECVHVMVSKMNESKKSKSAKKHKKQNVWKPTGHVFTEVGLKCKFLGTVRSGNDQIARIMGYGDYHIGNVIISRVYYVKGLGHNLFSVGQFCDADLEVSFQKNTRFIYNLEGVDLILGSRDINLYTISLDDMLKSSTICLLSKALKTNRWLWH
nr:retrovirus-related Pol polyprotein from transposon TNT 1-94 [Tanacetum cinerariifolium]